MQEIMQNVLRGLPGVAMLLLFAFLLSYNRRKISWRLVLSGIGLQLLFAILVLKTAPGRMLFTWFNEFITNLLGFSDQGASFIFGNLVSDFSIGAIFAFKVLPTIIFFSSLISCLYYLGVMQKIVEVFANLMMRVLGTSGAETLSCSANIFVGQTEAPLLIKPFVEKMTRSELLTVMTGGFATVAGGVMAAYVGMLQSSFPDIAGHLLSASIMNAPAAIYLSKMMLPEEEEPVTKGTVKADLPIEDSNIVEAAANGAGSGLQLALNVGGMLMAFIAIIAVISHAIKLVGGVLLGNPAYAVPVTIGSSPVNMLIGYRLLVFLGMGYLISLLFRNKMITEKLGSALKTNPAMAALVPGFLISMIVVIILDRVGSAYGSHINYDQLGLSFIFGWVFRPIAWALGVSWKDSLIIGSLLGERMAINEFVAYASLAKILQDGIEIEPRSVMIATYALCGFANFSSIAIQIGGIGGIAPSRRADLAKLGFHGVLAGTMATFMSATIAGMITSEVRLQVNPKKEVPVPTDTAPEFFNHRNDFSRYASRCLGTDRDEPRKKITIEIPGTSRAIFTDSPEDQKARTEKQYETGTLLKTGS